MKTEDYKRLTYNENDGLKEETVRRLTFDGSEDWKQNKLSEEEIIEDYINFIKVFAKKKQIENVNHLTFRGRRKEQLKILKNFLDLYQKEKEKNKTIKEYVEQCDWHDNDVYIGEDILEILEEEG